VPQHGIFYTDGKYALPLQGLYIGSSINVDLFEQAGLPMPWEHDHAGDKWWDWNDYREAANAINDLGDDIYGAGVLDWQRTWQWIWENGGDYIDVQKVEHTMASDEKCFEALAFLYQVHCLDGAGLPGDEFSALRETLGVQPAAAGKVGIPRRMEEGHWAAAELNGHRVVQPRSPNTGMTVSTHNHQPNCMFAKTPYPDEAWQLGVHMASYRAQLLIGLNGTSQPCRYSVIRAPEYLPDLPAVAKEALYEQVEGPSRFYHIFVGWHEWWDEYNPLMEPITACEPGSMEEMRVVLEELDTVLTDVIRASNPEPWPWGVK
jgi:ABC-type glycerol-3-phosphate transport system substrate-binding protein